jgi:hypothetical protein
MDEQDRINKPASQATNFNHYRLTEDSLAEDFARETDGLAMYVPSRGQWFTRQLDSDGAPFWSPDDRLKVLQLIRDYLRRIAAGHPRDYALNVRLGSAETVKAIEYLARSDLADDESALEPGRLAKSEEAGRLFLAEIRKGRAPATPAPVADRHTEPTTPAATPVTPQWGRK